MQLNDVLLTSQQQYRSDVSSLPLLTKNEERDLETLARNGDEKAKAALIEGCLKYISFIAWKHLAYIHHDDYLDLVGVGNLAVVECFEKALTTDNPSAYLRGAAKIAVKSYCRRYGSLIARDQNQEIKWVDSLDAPLGNSDVCYYDFIAAAEQKDEVKRTDHSTLRQAVAKLRKKQQYVITRYCGWDGDAPESIADIGERLSGCRNTTIAYNRFYMAVKNLQHMLVEQ